jgi:hypothetical protein
MFDVMDKVDMVVDLPPKFVASAVAFVVSNRERSTEELASDTLYLRSTLVGNLPSEAKK